MALRNPAWQRDELILALDLYFRHQPLSINGKHYEVKKLSDILNCLPIHNIRPDEQRFRNPNGVYMKLCNFLRYDPSYKGVGLKRGNKLEGEIWNEFSHDLKYLNQIALSIINGLRNNSLPTESREHDTCSDGEDSFPEGKVLYRQHRLRERNRKLIAQVKRDALSKGKLSCSVCEFDFFKTYGELGQGYIQCHHTIPLASYTLITDTKAKDLALVCANCHCMLHRRRPWLTKEQLSCLIRVGLHI
jgi:5-methylcytosine-specific restriction enzyme A